MKPCKTCKRRAVIENWSSGGKMYMVKCNNPDCPIPPEGYPKGRDLDNVIKDWNSRQDSEVEE